jgi:hypothetical protein
VDRERSHSLSRWLTMSSVWCGEFIKLKIALNNCPPYWTFLLFPTRPSSPAPLAHHSA